MTHFTFLGTCLTAIVFCFPVDYSIAQSDRIWINPGVKFSWTFADVSGFTIGPEISVVWERARGPAIGILLDYDHCASANRYKFHLGIEVHQVRYGLFPLGLSAGPTIIQEESRVHYGLTLTAYTGLVVIPFLNATIPFDGNLLTELGAYLKFPIKTYGPDISFH